jgi:hypothetical protein
MDYWLGGPGVKGTSGTVTSWEKEATQDLRGCGSALPGPLVPLVSEGVGVGLGSWEAELGRW